VANGVISGSGILAESAPTCADLEWQQHYSGGTTITGGTVSVTNLNSRAIRISGAADHLCRRRHAAEHRSGGQSTGKAITLNSGGGVITMSGSTISLTGTISGVAVSRAWKRPDSQPGKQQQHRHHDGEQRPLFIFSASAIANSAVLHINGGAILDFAVTADVACQYNDVCIGSSLANRVGTLTVSTANVTFPPRAQ